ncbi:MAG: protein-export chaperone SecB [Alphaproteobacteria bacterium]|nr:protein-export chaperone SecB [Alphaproteobacteria bacterium]MDG2457955.1 protein-export chaperone SecB [Alphaproteobacteria bacterium]|tara:strand:+ start:290 stop:715 length:426 start_codon:yes stop_codon:yes gene_type:complete
MNKVVNDETSNLIILNQYIKDLSYENFQKNGTQNFNTKENNTNIEINVIHEPYGETNFGVSIKITINSKSKKESNTIFHLELDYYGLFKSEGKKLVDKNKLASEGARIIFPFARSIIASVTQNGGFMPIILDNVNFNLMKS